MDEALLFTDPAGRSRHGKCTLRIPRQDSGFRRPNESPYRLDIVPICFRFLGNESPGRRLRCAHGRILVPFHLASVFEGDEYEPAAQNRAHCERGKRYGLTQLGFAAVLNHRSDHDDGKVASREKYEEKGVEEFQKEGHQSIMTPSHCPVLKRTRQAPVA